jgi:hypothetical protein
MPQEAGSAERARPAELITKQLIATLRTRTLSRDLSWRCQNQNQHPKMRELKMGLFDSYFDPQTVSGESGDLLGRLLSLQQEQRQYQPGAGFDQAPSVQQTPDYGQTQNVAVGGYQMPQFGRADISPRLQQPPDFGDRLSAGFQNWAHTPVGNPFAALANGVAGFGSGQRTDAAGVVLPQTPSPTPDLGDRLSAGFQNWARTPVGNPFAALANGITGPGSGQRITDPVTAPQTPQARLAALKFLRGEQDAAPEAADPQAGNPLIAAALARQQADNAASPENPASPRKARANVPWSIKPNVKSWSIK